MGFYVRSRSLSLLAFVSIPMQFYTSNRLFTLPSALSQVTSGGPFRVFTLIRLFYKLIVTTTPENSSYQLVLNNSRWLAYALQIFRFDLACKFFIQGSLLFLPFPVTRRADETDVGLGGGVRREFPIFPSTCLLRSREYSKATCAFLGTF